MEKNLTHRLSMCMAALMLAAALLFGGGGWMIGKWLVYREMGQILEQEEKFYKNMQQMQEAKLRHLASDYAEKNNGEELPSGSADLNEAMAGMMLQIPTSHDNAMLAFDRTTGELLGAAAENNPILSVRNICEDRPIQECYLDKDQECIIRVEGRFVFLKTRIVDNVVFADFRLAHTLIGKIGWMLAGILVLLFAMLYVTFLVNRRYFKIYIFDEIRDIRDTIQRLIGGEKNATFRKGRTEEMNEIIEILNDWNNNIQYTQKKLNWVINATNPNAAMFECLSYMQTAYFSDNLQMVLGMEPAQWEGIRSSEEKFRNYFSKLEKEKNDRGIVEEGGKFLFLRLYQMEQDYFGIVVDKTASVKRKEQMANDLQHALDDSETDSLTGLLNRRGFEGHVEQALSEGNGSGVLLMMDVDNFKRVNDNLGHPEGDIFLQKVGECLKAQFRRVDVLARLGGDEFAVFFSAKLPDGTLERKLSEFLERVRREFSEYREYEVTLSIGAAVINGPGVCYTELYECADRALYQAKRAGKDRYRILTYNKKQPEDSI